MVRGFEGEGDKQQRVATMALKHIFPGFQIGKTVTDRDGKVIGMTTMMDTLQQKTIERIGKTMGMEKAQKLPRPELNVHMWETLTDFADKSGIHANWESIEGWNAIANALEKGASGTRKLDLDTL